MDRQTERQTDMTKLIVACRNLADVLKYGHITGIAALSFQPNLNITTGVLIKLN